MCFFFFFNSFVALSGCLPHLNQALEFSNSEDRTKCRQREWGVSGADPGGLAQDCWDLSALFKIGWEAVGRSWEGVGVIWLYLFDNHSLAAYRWGSRVRSGSGQGWWGSGVGGGVGRFRQECNRDRGIVGSIQDGSGGNWRAIMLPLRPKTEQTLVSVECLRFFQMERDREWGMRHGCIIFIHFTKILSQTWKCL